MGIAEIQKKVEYGDYNTLGKMLNVPPTTAKARLVRGNEEAKEAIILIIEAREKLIYDFHNRSEKV